MRAIYLLQSPGILGGVATKLDHLFSLLCDEFAVYSIPDLVDVPPQSEDLPYRRYSAPDRIPFNDLPARLDGAWGLLLCDTTPLYNGKLWELRRRGLKIAWGNEVMTPFPMELGALVAGAFDCVLFVSACQRESLEPYYRQILECRSRPPKFDGVRDDVEGWLNAADGSRLIRWVMAGNYISPEKFPLRVRNVEPPYPELVVGHLSRPDPLKFHEHFPRFFEGFHLRNARFRVMGWSSDLSSCWPDHDFRRNWELLPALSETTVTFLHSLDVIVFRPRADWRESWGRAILEAMLCGVIPLVPQANGRHHCSTFIEHGVSGFHCATDEEFGYFARLLEEDVDLRSQISRQARIRAENVFCSRESHREMWRKVFH